MTLTVALIGGQSIVAATDSRGTFGDPRATTAQNDTMQKLYGVSDHVVVTIAGTAELGAQLLAEIRTAIDGQGLDGVTPIMELVRATTRERFSEWFPGWQVQATTGQPVPVRPDLALLVTGYEREAGGFGQPKIYQLVSQYDFAPMLSSHGFALQGVPQYALYLLNRLYETDAVFDELMALACYVITETASQDGKVGGPVQLATIRPDEGCAILAPNEIEEVIRANTDRSARLKGSFFSARSSGRRGTSRGTSEPQP